MRLPYISAGLGLLLTFGPLAEAKTSYGRKAKAPALRPQMAKATLVKPALLRPRATAYDSRLLANNSLASAAPVCAVRTEGGAPIYVNQSQPSYLSHFNRSITSPGSGGFTIFKYQSLCTNQPGQPIHLWDPSSANAGMGDGGGGGGGMPGGLPGGMGGQTPFANGSQPYATPGSPYRGGSDGGWYSSGPDTLCRGNTGSFQTKKPNELLGGSDLSLCDVIYNTIKDETCPNGDTSTAEYARQLAAGEIGEMETFCPGWNQIKGDPEKRAIMLMNMVAAIVKTESGWNNLSIGDGGRSKGMLQLTASTDRKHGCHCSGLRNELDAKQNLMCGTHMIISFMARDGVVGQGSGEHCGGDASGCGAQGIARSFGPFRNGRKEKADIKRRVSAWCKESLQQNATAPESNTLANK